MDDFEANVQALVRDIESNYGDGSYEQSPWPASRPASHSYQSQLPQSQLPRHTPVSTYGEHQLPLSLVPNLPDTYHYHANFGAGLDGFDKALLAEPPTHTYWQSGNGSTMAPAGRLTLPGHAAPCLPAKPFEQPIQPRERGRPPPQRFRPHPGTVFTNQTKIELRRGVAQPLRTPPAHLNSSSPPNAPLSSPSFKIKRRRATNTIQPSSDQGTTFLPSNQPLTDNISVDPRKKSLQVSNGNDMGHNHSFSSLSSPRPHLHPQIELKHAPPIVQGVQLVSLNELPDRLRSVFRHQLFNAIQSKCFATAYKSNDNFVVSAPTGGGKTAILEMAICRLVFGFKTEEYKIVYMAPTKSLCSERQRDWQAKFATLDLQCAELTGDTEHGQLRNVQSASIVITTPEKWDSMTRKWKDHAKLMKMVKLFLIDEVHILKDTRGATLEAVVSRMKSVGSNVRFIALSATVPNSEDIAKWLGKDPSNQHTPAPQEKFGEEFRPVRLQKHVIGLPYNGNDFGFEGACDLKLPDIIAKFSHRKPIMVFCITRNSTINTAKLLANVWASKGPRDRYWEAPTQRIVVQDPELKNTLTSAVAFHHAGLDSSDRYAIEKGFLEGQINVICCTSTLAVGVNLPCHMVIIKNTMHWSEEGLKEYADLEVMQMLGRAGRPQFDTTATAVIITKQEKQHRYEKLVSGEELLESCLHVNLIDHLNAEVGLGTVYDLYTAKRWLAGTFLYVRLGQNPNHYKLDGDTVNQNLDDRIERICIRDLSLLEQSNLISSANDKLKTTELGDAMARYYVKYGTMQVLLQMQPRDKISAMLSAIVQAQEFRDIRLKANEKKLYRHINQANGIKFPIKVDLAMDAHKRSLILQAELGGVEYPSDEQYVKHKRQYNQDKTILFSHVHRLVNCIIDCQIHLQDAIAARHALELARSFSARAWDNSPYQMKQIAQIGLVAVRKLAIGGINSIEALEAAEPQKIEMLLSKNPPFGQKMLNNLRDFPKLRVALKLVDKDTRTGRPVNIKIRAECGFMNERAPMTFNGKPFNVCLLTERSDGHLLDFRRISAKNLNNGKDILMSADVISCSQYITCYVMCDTIAGTLRYAELKPDLPSYLFPPSRTQPRVTGQVRDSLSINDSGEAEENIQTSPATLDDDDFGEDEIEDQDMVDAATRMDFRHIDKYAVESDERQSNLQSRDGHHSTAEQGSWNPERLDNGKWACNHKCKDKTLCKHLCCREGVDKAPKAPKSAFVNARSLVDTTNGRNRKETSTSVSRKKNMSSSNTSTKNQLSRTEILNLAHEEKPDGRLKKQPEALKALQRLHESVIQGGPTISAMGTRKPPLQPRSTLNKHDLSTTKLSEIPSTDYDGDWVEGLPSPSALLSKDRLVDESAPQASTNHGISWHDSLPSPSALLGGDDTVAETNFDNDSLEEFDLSQFNDDEQLDLEAAMVGLGDSITMNESSQTRPTLKGGHQTVTGTGLLQTQGCMTGDIVKPSSSNGSSISSKLFLSTDSPEKPAKWTETGDEAVDSDTDGLALSAPVPKRQRMYDQAEAALQGHSEIKKETAAPAPTIKPGQPAWVYKFDPGFIAEWQDFVDFV